MEDYIGGAELTSESLIKSCKHPIVKVKSATINEQLIDEHRDSIWIFGNFAQIKLNLLMKFVKEKINYHIVEYDFKFCKLRSPEKHILTNDKCICEEESRGKLISIFFAKAKALWFMSEKQRDEYVRRFSFLKDSQSYVLSSIFEEDLIAKLIQVDVERKEEWIILESASWIKGTQDAIEYARKNQMSYRLVGGVSYNDMLNTLSSSKGLIFLPKGGDTCPRIVIEAHLLGCKLVLNENVLHKDEEWFTGSREDCANYLKGRSTFFWDTMDRENA